MRQPPAPGPEIFTHFTQLSKAASQAGTFLLQLRGFAAVGLAGDLGLEWCGGAGETRQLGPEFCSLDFRGP